MDKTQSNVVIKQPELIIGLLYAFSDLIKDILLISK